MYITWERIKDSLYLTAENSGASIDYARGSIIGVVSALQAVGMNFKESWPHIVKCLPDAVRVEAIPTVWLHCENDWHGNLIKEFVHGGIVLFKDLLKEIPEKMQKETDDKMFGMTCRDQMLDKYLSIIAIMQRETERAWEEHKQTGGESPLLVYSFVPFRLSGSQYVAEWSVSDLRKEYKETTNWHGQNTSRWLYAGCLLVQDGRVSIHT